MPFQQLNRSENGATMVEYALIIGTFLLISLGVLDISRYLIGRVVLNRAAYMGLTTAQQILGFDTDIRLVPPAQCSMPGASAFPSVCSTNMATCPWVILTKCARDAAILAATSYATSTYFDSPNTAGSRAYLTEFDTDEVYNNGNTTYNAQPSAAAILRPGERAMNVATGEWECHPSLWPRINTGCSPPLPPAPSPVPAINNNTPWLDVLGQHPITVVMRAEIFPILPWPFIADRVVIVSRVSGFREISRLVRVPPDMGIPITPILPVSPIAPPPQCPSASPDCAQSGASGP